MKRLENELPSTEEEIEEVILLSHLLKVADAYLLDTQFVSKVNIKDSTFI